MEELSKLNYSCVKSAWKSYGGNQRQCVCYLCASAVSLKEADRPASLCTRRKNIKYNSKAFISRAVGARAAAALSWPWDALGSVVAQLILFNAFTLYWGIFCQMK